MNRLVWVVVVLAAALPAAGCGGGSSSSTGAATTSTSAGGGAGGGEYASQGNAICTEAREANLAHEEELARILEHGLTGPAVRKKAAGLIRSGFPAVAEENRAFEKLTPPAGLEHTQVRLITKLRYEIAIERLFAKALEVGSQHELGILFGRLGANDLAIRGAAIHLGLKVCGKLLQGAQSTHGLA